MTRITIDDPARTPIAVPGIVIFIIADIASFMLFFAVFMADRQQDITLFRLSAAQLDVDIGLANTLILITSGWCVAQAEARYRSGRGDHRPWLFAAIAVGAVFAILKGWEYGAKIASGITPETNPFFTYYFVFTAIHALHYTAGMMLLMFLASRRLAARSDYGHWLHAGALYWHMVDILWIFIFPLLYLQTS